jgi:hypothetical protein
MEDKQATYTYTLPARVAKASGYKSVTIAALTVEDEQLALKRCHNEPLRIANECAKQSLKAIDGRAVSDVDASIDRVWEQLGAIGRRLIVHAYAQLNQPQENEYGDFMKGQVVEVG